MNFKKHPLSRGQRDAIVAIAKAPRGLLSDAQLRRAIGSYATNVINALERERELIVHQLALEGLDGGWMLTERGHQVLQQLANDRTRQPTG